MTKYFSTIIALLIVGSALTLYLFNNTSYKAAESTDTANKAAESVVTHTDVETEEHLTLEAAQEIAKTTSAQTDEEEHRLQDDQLESAQEVDRADSHISGTYPIVDTGQTSCYGNTSSISCPTRGAAYFGQDAQYETNKPTYKDNGDGTVTDLVTGLMWVKNAGEKQQYYDAIQNANTFSYAGYSDWRVPTIKELYSLMDFRGTDPSSANANVSNLIPFIDTDYFDFEYGDESAGSRIIDSQWITSSIYESTVMNGQECFFGVNFADGRIKCYPTRSGGSAGYFLRMVRGNPSYGTNSFVANGDGTVSDNATGLIWQQADNGTSVLWDDALVFCENLTLDDKTDWRLPDIKELQSIIDYTRSPDTTASPALDPIFTATVITNEANQKDWAFYWSGTTHKSQTSADSAAYISFGRALGNMSEFGGWIDVHGAGAQRSDAKSGVPAGQEDGHGPQGDARRSYNYVRCVRGDATLTTDTSLDTTVSSSNNQTGQPPEPPEGAPTQSQTGGGAPGGGSPPQEAISACAGKSNSTTCSFTTPQGKRSGTCRTTPDNTVACVP